MKQHVVCSDRYVGQFKSVMAWYFLGKYHNYAISEQLLGGCQRSWNYFATGHCNGEVNGAGALLKRKLWKEQIKLHGLKIQNASEAIHFL
jgi:hypothetical protein